MSSISATVSRGVVEDGLTPVVVKLIPPDVRQRCPADIAIILDTSGSMSGMARAGGEASSLSMLDVAVHGVRTVIQTLLPQDRLCLVSFCGNASLILALTAMDVAGKVLAEAGLSGLEAAGGTNISAGLSMALAELAVAAASGGSGQRFAHALILTDGDTLEGPAGVRLTLSTYLAKHERLPCALSAFGFGPGACSPLLHELAVLGAGGCGYIPDSGFVGTAFIGYLSNVLCTAASQVSVTLEAGDGCEIVDVLGGLRAQTLHLADFRVVQLGSLQGGQSREVVLLMKLPAEQLQDAYLYVRVTHGGHGSGHLEVQGGGAEDGARDVEADVSVQLSRAKLVDLLQGIPASPSAAPLQLRALAREIRASPGAFARETLALLEDIEGQCALAVSRPDYWNDWGVHYVLSLACAHKTQQCTNFKDPGVQVYGGRLFEQLRDAADEVFNALPAPRTSRGGPTAARPDMRSFNDRNGGCVAGDSVAMLASGQPRRVSELRKGDLVQGRAGLVATIECMVEMPCHSGVALLAGVSSGLRLTGYHPVWHEGAWVFPADHYQVRELPCSAVYSYVLSGAPAMLIGGRLVVALGHGLQEGAAAHTYFATPKVLQDLRQMPGYAKGHVLLAPGRATRDKSGLVCGLASQELHLAGGAV